MLLRAREPLAGVTVKVPVTPPELSVNTMPLPVLASSAVNSPGPIGGSRPLRQPAKPREHRPRSSAPAKSTSNERPSAKLMVKSTSPAGSGNQSQAMLPERMGTPSPSLNTESGVSNPIERRPSRVAVSPPSSPTLIHVPETSLNMEEGAGLLHLSGYPDPPSRSSSADRQWSQRRKINRLHIPTILEPDAAQDTRQSFEIHNSSSAERLLRVTTRGGGAAAKCLRDQGLNQHPPPHLRSGIISTRHGEVSESAAIGGDGGSRSNGVKTCLQAIKNFANRGGRH